MKKIATYIGCLTTVLILFISTSNAQTGTDKILIKGKVIDSKDKSTIIGVSVIEKDKDDRTVTGVQTNIDGEFAIKVSSTANKLSFSFIGYTTKILPIGDTRTFTVSLVSTTNNLNTVEIRSAPVTSDGNLTIDKRDATVSNATIQAKDLEELSALSIEESLVGRLPGVDIVASSGDPGAGMAIRIRGTSSINGATNPLIVVDGIPYETAVPQDFNFATADEQGYANLLSIAPSDIKDITVLKDAAATAVWGSRASNGVLIINTKRGTVSPPVITYTFRGALTAQPEAIPLLNGNQYSELIPEEVQNATGIPLAATTPEFQHDKVNPYYYYNYGQNSDWLAAITRTGYETENNISLTGGGEKARYFASVGYNNTAGTTIGTAFNRLNARLNLDYFVSTKIKFRSDIAYTHSVTEGNYGLDIRAIAQKKMPNQSIYEYDEFGNKTDHFFSPAQNIQGQYPGTYNPLALAHNGVDNTYADRITPHFTLDYTIIPNLLRLNQDVQFDISTSKRATFLPQDATGRPVTETVVNRAYNFDSDGFTVQDKTNFTLTPNLGEKHSVLALLSLQLSDSKNNGQSVLTSNTASTYLQDPSAGSRIQNAELGIASTASETRTVAALLQTQYKYLDRYIVYGTLRMDGNSNFGPGERYGLFPSISGRYRISGESFMKKMTFVDDLSLTAGYGISGNAPGSPYSFYNTYNVYNFQYANQGGISSGNIGLDHLRYEKVTGKDLGLNLAMAKNRINLNLSLYQHTTTDLFFNTTLPSFDGFTAVTLNVGTLDNQGYEINLNTTIIKSKNVTIDFNLNAAHNENIIRAISPYVNPQTGSGSVNGSYISTLHIDNPLGSFYGYVYQGVYKDAAATIATDKNGKPIIVPGSSTPLHMMFNYNTATPYQFQPGDAKYQDINHDGLIDTKDIVYLGNGNPKLTGGFGPTISYKGNWRLNLFFSYRSGFSIINTTEMNTSNEYGFDNQSTVVLRRWEKPGDVTDVPRALYGAGYNWLGSSRYVQDGSFIKFSSATVRYNINPLFAKKLGLRNASIYVTGQNLFTWTGYLGQDPEISPRAGDIYQQPLDGSTTPPVKKFTLGLTATF